MNFDFVFSKYIGISDYNVNPAMDTLAWSSLFATTFLLVSLLKTVVEAGSNGKDLHMLLQLVALMLIGIMIFKDKREEAGVDGQRIMLSFEGG